MCQGVTSRCFLRSAACLLAFMRAGWLYKCVCVWLCSCWAPQVHRPSITRCGHYTQAGVEVDNAPTAATAGASTACGSSVWLASGNQGDSGLPVCVTDNVTSTHLYTRARKYTNPSTHTQSTGVLLWRKAKHIQEVVKFRISHKIMVSQNLNLDFAQKVVNTTQVAFWWHIASLQWRRLVQFISFSLSHCSKYLTASQSMLRDISPTQSYSPEIKNTFAELI